ncbi:MAG TPA: histidine kinase [Chloroflexota bacterium]
MAASLPALTSSAGVIDILFERMPMGIAIVDRRFCVRRCNPTFAEFLVRGTGHEPSEVVPGIGLFVIEPGVQDVIRPLLARALAGETIRLDGAPLTTCEDAHWYWDLVLAPLAGEDGPEVLVVTTDVTERAHAQQLLEGRVEARTRELEALYRADEQLHRSLRLEHVLEALVDVATDILQADMTSVLVWDEAHEYLMPGATRGFDAELVARMSHPAGDGVTALVAASGQPLAIEDAASDPRVKRSIVEAAGIRSLMHVPITIGDQVFGVFGVNYRERRTLTAQDQRLLRALGQRAALAIENARLYEQAHEMAAARERQRLARDLHDSVTQTLFSATLIAEVLPTLWERNPDEGRRRLEELRQLSRGALAEMRTLLFELRPAALAQVPFADLLNQLVEAINGRTRLPIKVQARGQAGLPAEVHMAFYRIAQEALNNIARHSAATQAAVSWDVTPRRAQLRIQDDGQGFRPEAVAGGHLGLSIMRERAQAIGAELIVRSKPGHGTRVVARWRRP